MEKKQRVFLFDAYALIYRAYYAFINRPMINSKGINTSAIFGFTTTLTDILNRERPDYAAVVFDPPSPTFRNDLYSQYKANRLSTPEEIKKSIPVIKSIIEAFSIPVIEVCGFEADDVIGTLARQSEKEGLFTFMVTPDKDYMQLVTEKIKMLKPGRSGGEYEEIGIQQVNDFFGIDDPSKVTDILALWGDASDNVPGAPGIGEKTARDLIREYKSLNNLLAHVDELKPKQRDSLTHNYEQVRLSHELVKINVAVPLTLKPEDLIIKPWDERKLKEIFQELEFRTLSSRIFKNTTQGPMQRSLFEVVNPEEQINVERITKNIHNVPHQYHVVTTSADLESLAERLSTLTEFCFDTETTGLNCREAELVGMSFSFKTTEGYYVPIPPDFNQANEILNHFRPVFKN
jgi:DNA polymerase-1